MDIVSNLYIFYYDVGHAQDVNCLNVVVVVRLEIFRTYDDVVDYFIRELEIRHIYRHQSTKFSGFKCF